MRQTVLLALLAAVALTSWAVLPTISQPVAASSGVVGDEITPEVQKKIDEWKKTIQVWANDATLTSAVEKQNKVGPIRGMDKATWKKTRRRSDIVKELSENDAAKFLVAKQEESKGVVTEAFLNAEKGEKVAFIAKTSSYIHKGKAKFDVPFDTGKAWQGDPEFDESAQTYQVQISVPVMVKAEKSDEKPTKRIGVLVVGVDIGALAKQ